jgi:hypothetical protein
MVEKNYDLEYLRVEAEDNLRKNILRRKANVQDTTLLL